jgi:flagellar biosynthetic protein FliR
MPIDVAQIEFFILIFIRIVSAISVLPVFGHTANPPMAKAGLAMAMAFLLMPTLTATMPPPSGTILDFVGLGMRETVCGLLLGFVGQFVFYAVDVAGQLVGFQAGFSIVSSIDPNTESQSTVLTQFYNIASMLVFLSIDGHHVLLKGVADSLKVIPIGHLSVDGRLSEWMVGAVTGIMANGIQIAAPLMVTLLLVDIGLGILTRVAPAMNVFVLGFPLKISITLIMVSMTLGMVMSVFSFQFSAFARGLPAFMKLLVAP